MNWSDKTDCNTWGLAPATLCRRVTSRRHCSTQLSCVKSERSKEFGCQVGLPWNLKPDGPFASPRVLLGSIATESCQVWPICNSVAALTCTACCGIPCFLCPCFFREGDLEWLHFLLQLFTASRCLALVQRVLVSCLGHATRLASNWPGRSVGRPAATAGAQVQGKVDAVTVGCGQIEKTKGHHPVPGSTNPLPFCLFGAPSHFPLL